MSSSRWYGFLNSLGHAWQRLLPFKENGMPAPPRMDVRTSSSISDVASYEREPLMRFNGGTPAPPILNPFRHKSLPAGLSGQSPMRCMTVGIFDEAVGAAGMIVAISSETMSFEK